MPKQHRAAKEESVPAGEAAVETAQTKGRTKPRRIREVGETVAVLLKVATAAIALYAAIKGIGLVS